MPRRITTIAGAGSALAILASLAGCSVEETPPSGETGGSAGSGFGGTSGAAGSATGGAVATGGASSGGASSGGSDVGYGGSGAGAGGAAAGSSPGGAGGQGASAGTVAGGSASGGTSGGGASGGGASSGASGGGASSSGAGGMPSGAVPSQGCGKGGRPSTTNVPNTIVSFPQSYDGTRPMPLVFGLHGAGRTNEQFRTVDARTQGSALETHFVMAYVKSAGSGWVLDTDRARIDTAYTELLANYCIDTSRVFATGHSSGAQMIVQLLCAGEERFRAVAPVASSMYCQRWDAIPTLLIHGANDTERASTNQDADGRKDLGPYLTSNGCGMTTTPYASVMGCSSGGTQVNPGCVQYSCTGAQMLWCQHNDPNYSNTNHGWPCFANTAMDAFLAAQ
jgi:polyhydroxybutyrate depolymerase